MPGPNAASRRLPRQADGHPAGSQRFLRHALGPRTWCLLPVTVLDDRRGWAAVRISAGTDWLAAVGPDGRRVRLGAARWRLGPAHWRDHDLTYLMAPRRWYALGVLCRAGTGEPATPRQ